MQFRFKKDLVTNFFLYAAGYIVPGILSFLLIPFIIRNYGAEVYAQYSILFNCLSVISMFCYNWVGQAYIRFYTGRYKGIDIVFNNYLKLSLVAGSLLFIVVSFFIANINPGYLFIVVPVFFLSGYYNFNLLKNQAKQRAKQTALAEMIRTAITIIVPLAAVLFVKNLYALPVLFASLLLGYASGLLYLSKKENNNAQAEQQELPDISIIKKQIREYGIPIAFFVSVSLALTVNDRYLIAHLMDYKSSGNYGALYDLLNKGVGFSCAPVIMTYFPHIVKQFNGGNKAGAYSSIKKALLLEAIIFITGLACLALFGKFFFELFLKHTVGNDTMQLAYILYTGVFVWQAAMLVHKPLELRLQTRYMAIGVFIAFAVNITANYFLIKQYHDVMMAAWTTLGSSLLYLFFIIFKIFAKKKADKTNGILHN